MINGKLWYQSKTLWVAVLLIVVAVAEYIAGLPPETTVPQAISGILMIVLRLITKTSIVGRPAS